MANSPSQTPCGRILLVDDNSLGLAARRSVLEELGHQVKTSGTAAEALELCGRQSFDVVVTDYKMPKMNGIELIGRLRKLHPATSVISLTTGEPLRKFTFAVHNRHPTIRQLKGKRSSTHTE